MTNRWLVPAVALLVVLPIGGAIAEALTSGDDRSPLENARVDRSGSVSLGRAPAPLLPESTPRTYSMLYRVVNTAGAEVAITNDEVHVRRPFDARVVTRAGGELREGELRGERVSVLTKLASRGADGTWTLFEIPPALATSDVRFGAALDQALADGDIVVRERRRVAGRECQVFRAGSSLQAGVLTPYDPASSTFADVCVDGEGLVLEEVWTLDGKRVLRRLAVEVETGVALEDELFALPERAETLTVAEGGGEARRLDPASRPPGPFRELPAEAVPTGFTHIGRWSVLSPRLELFRDPTHLAQGGSTSSIIDVWVRGTDVLVVDRGGFTGTPSLPEPEVARPVDLGGLGQGIAITDFRMNEVRGVGGGGFTRVYGTLPVPLLVEAARALAVVPGGELRYLDAR